MTPHSNIDVRGKQKSEEALPAEQSTKTGSRFQKGLSLPEVLVSTLIVLMGIAALLSTFLAGRFANATAQHYGQAMSLARAHVEYLESLPYKELSSLPSTTAESRLPLDPGDSGNFIPCDRLTTLQQEDNGMRIEVVVSWDEMSTGTGSRPCSFALTTWVVSPRKASAT